jgi:hypothetical protein
VTHVTQWHDKWAHSFEPLETEVLHFRIILNRLYDTNSCHLSDTFTLLVSNFVCRPDVEA